MNRVAKAASWSALGLVAAVVLVEAAAAWVVVQVVKAVEEAEQ
jgi:hypothetical protein